MYVVWELWTEDKQLTINKLIRAEKVCSIRRGKYAVDCHSWHERSLTEDNLYKPSSVQGVSQNLWFRLAPSGLIIMNNFSVRHRFLLFGWVLADKMSKHQMQTVLWDTLYVWLTLVPDVPAEFTPSHPGLVPCWPGHTNADWKTTRNITQYNNNTAQTAAAALQTPDLCAILTALPNSFYNHLQIAS